MTPGNQAMAAAAQMAAPPGSPPMPKAPAEPAQEQQGADPTATQKAIEGKDKEISSLRNQVQEARLQAAKAEMKAELQNSQQQYMDKIRKEQVALDKRQTQLAADEERHRARLELDATRQKADVAKAEADAEVQIARRDAESLKSTADANAKAYVKMTDDARKASDSYRVQQQQAFNKSVQAQKDSTPYVSAALKNQLKGAMAAAHNVGKLRMRLAKNAAATAPQPPPAQQASPTPQPPADSPQPPAAVTKQAPAAPQQVAAASKQQVAPSPQQPAANQPPAAAPHLTAQQQEASQRAYYAAQAAQKATRRRTEAEHKLTRIGDKVSMQGDLVHRNKEIITAEAQLNRLMKDPNASAEEIGRWKEALETATQARNGYLSGLQARSDAGDKKAKDELTRLQDFQQKRETSGNAGFLRTIPLFGSLLATPFSSEKSEEDEYREAAEAGMDPEEYAAHKEDQKSFLRSAVDFINPFDDVGDSLNNWRRSRQLARNRGLSLNWVDNDYEGAAGDSLEQALAARNLNGTVLGNAAQTGLDTGLAALDTLGTMALATGIGALPGAALKGAAGASRAARAANAAYKAGKSLKFVRRAAGAGWKRGAQQMGKAIPNMRGLGTVHKGIQNWNKTTLGKLDNTLGWAPMIGTGASLAGQLAGTDVLNWMDLYQHKSTPYQQQNPGLVTASGHLMGAGGKIHGQLTDDYGRPYGYDLYKQVAPNYERLMLNPGDAGKAVAMDAAQTKTASMHNWSSPKASNHYLDTPYTDTTAGRVVSFASPLVSMLTGGAVQLTPSVALPAAGSLAQWDPDSVYAATAAQSTNPLYNPDHGDRGLVGHLVEMRKQTIAHPKNHRIRANAAQYHAVPGLAF